MIAQLTRLLFYICNYRRIWSQQEVIELFDSAQGLYDMSSKLSLLGYIWHGEFYWLDWNKTPREMLANMENNCGDFAMFFQEFAKHKKISQEIHQIYFEKYESLWQWIWNPVWHYITVFKINDELFVQSNLNISKIESIDAAINLYKMGGRYNYYEVERVQ